MEPISLLWLVLLLIANGFFVAAEFAYITARRNVLAESTTRSSTLAVDLSKDLSLSLAGAQLGITMASLLLGAVAEPAIAGILEAGLGFIEMPEGTRHAIAFVVALLIVVFLHMVIGEMAPKNIAISSPEATARALALPFRFFIVVFRPLIAILNGIANSILRLLGIQPADALEVSHTSEDLAVVIGAGRKEGIIGDFAHRLLTGAILFGDKDASDVMTPRPDVIAAGASDSAAEVLSIMRESGHSRIPLHTGDLDDVVGFVHIKDLISLDAAERERPIPDEMRREALAVPESASIQSVLSSMRRSRSHIAIVVDEHGTAAGIVTMEDVAEELVGDIADEHDLDEDHVRVGMGGDLLVAGSSRLDELEELGIELPSGEYSTVGGLVMDHLGRVPRRGDVVTVDGWRLTVRTISRRRVGELAIRRVPTPVSDD